MSTAIDERHDRIAREREVGLTITDDQMVEAVGRLSVTVQMFLARGPIGRRWDCCVCDVLDPVIHWRADADADFDDPAWTVFLYHEAPKQGMKCNDELHYGEKANETYRRCVAIYRAAGWTGAAEAPNA